MVMIISPFAQLAAADWGAGSASSQFLSASNSLQPHANCQCASCPGGNRCCCKVKHSADGPEYIPGCGSQETAKVAAASVYQSFLPSSEAAHSAVLAMPQQPVASSDVVPASRASSPEIQPPQA
jgi:hypothetical protein